MSYQRAQLKNKKGFTLIEVLLSIAIIAIIAGIGTPIYQAFQNRNNLDIAATTVVQNLRRAQVLSQAADGDNSWGVQVATGTITIFRGASYATRDASFDEITTIPTNLSLSGTEEYVFSKFEGELSSEGTTTLTSVNNEVRNVVINTKGTVSSAIAEAEEEGGGGGGGGGTIICTELFAQGYLSEEVYAADQAYGAKMGHERPLLMRGYYLWARPVVLVMQESPIATRIVALFARPWAKQMAYEMGVVEKGSVIGKSMMLVGEPLTEAVGLFAYSFEYGKQFLSRK